MSTSIAARRADLISIVPFEAVTTAPSRVPEIVSYPGDVPRKLSKPRPRQGARLAALRRAAGLTQAELADLIGDVQPNIAYWEASEKPPRSDVLPRLAKVLGVSVEDLLSADLLTEPKRGPVGRMQKVFADVSQLPRRQQAKIIELVEALVDQHRRKASLFRDTITCISRFGSRCRPLCCARRRSLGRSAAEDRMEWSRLLYRATTGGHTDGSCWGNPELMLAADMRMTRQSLS